jgi:hypothetical protein
MKRTVDFAQFLYNFQCPYCEDQVYWKQQWDKYYAICSCGKEYYLIPTKAKLEVID